MAAAARTLLPEVDDLSAGRFLGALAGFEAMAGQVDAALVDSERSLELVQRTGSQHFHVNALNGRAWALQRDDPVGALAAAESFLELSDNGKFHRGLAPGMMSLAASLRSRLGDDAGALTLLRDAAVIARDDGTRPQAAAALGFSLNPLCRTGRHEVAAVLIGALDRGAFAAAAHFPGAAEGRARTLARVADELGAPKTDELGAIGAAMPYDELIAYVIEQLGEAAS